MSASDDLNTDLSGMILRLAGEAGQVSLARCADQAGARASVDQHASEIRDALTSTGRKVTPAGGWCPPHRQERDPWDDEPLLDWESLRLAAVCRMFIEAQGLGITA